MIWQTNRKQAPKPEPAPGLLIGSAIQAVCRKCKDRTEHVVIAKVGVKPTRVECSSCKDVHVYKTVMRPAATIPLAGLSPEEAWTASMKRANASSALPYAVDGRYAIGAKLSHRSFGEGVVVRLASPTVCEVVFATGTIKLVMARTETDPSLLKPADLKANRPLLRSRRRMG